MATSNNNALGGASGNGDAQPTRAASLISLRRTSSAVKTELGRSRSFPG